MDGDGGGDGDGDGDGVPGGTDKMIVPNGMVENLTLKRYHFML